MAGEEQGSEMIGELRRKLEGKRAVLLAIGNPMRGDDALGACLADRLQGKVGATVVDAGEVPENYVGVVAAAQPEIVVIVDAAELGAAAGDVAVVAPDDLGSATFSTHNSGLALFVRFLRSEIPADIVIIGVQPSSTAYGQAMTPEVGATIAVLQELFERCWPLADTSD
jgi:hydrogenase 3 maturation protease